MPLAVSGIPVRLRPSAMTDWQGCGKRFELSVFKGARPAWRHPSAMNGTAIHAIIAFIHNNSLWGIEREGVEKMYDEEFVRAFEGQDADVPVFWGNGSEAEQEEAKRKALVVFKDDATKMILGYCADPRNRDAVLLATEMNWRATFGGFDWEGTLDQARVAPDGTVEIVDLKSSQRPLGPVPLAMWTQGLSYALAMENALFRPIAADPHAPWKPISARVGRVTWAQLRDYIPYLKSGRASSGREYRKGDLRGPVFYSIDVTRKLLDSHAREVMYFAQAVTSGRFERRPSNDQCSNCKVSAACLREFRDANDVAADGILPELAITGGEE